MSECSPNVAPVGSYIVTTALPNDVKLLSWAAEQLGIGTSTAYRLVAAGKIPGAFRIGAQWRISVPRFLAEVHGERPRGDSA